MKNLEFWIETCISIGQLVPVLFVFSDCQGAIATVEFHDTQPLNIIC